MQGVFFRVATQATAQRLGLTGWVRNLADGRVELVACGNDKQLVDLQRWLWRGPPAARVEAVHESDVEPQSFSGFGVRRDG